MQSVETPQSSDRFSALRRWWFAPDSRWVRVPLTAFLMTRVIVLVGAYLPPMLGIQLYDNPPNNTKIVEGPLGVWAKWDSNWYMRVAEEGYYYSDQPGAESTVAFFPLYPITVRVFSLLTGGNFMLAGLLVNNLTFLFALMAFYKLAEFDLDISSTRRAIFYLAAFPGALFFSAAYSEGVFLLVSVLAVLCARRQTWFWASFWAGLSAASRLPGFLVGMMVLLEWLRVQGWTLSTIHQRESWRNLLRTLRTHGLQLLLMTVLMTSGLWLFMLYMAVRFGNPFMYLVSANQGWHEIQFTVLRPLQVIMRDLQQSFSASPPKHVLPGFAAVDVGVFVLVILCSIFIWRRFRESYALYCGLHLFMPLFAYTQGMVRYTAVLFPVFMLLGVWGRRPWLNRVLLYTFFTASMSLYSFICELGVYRLTYLPTRHK